MRRAAIGLLAAVSACVPAHATPRPAGCVEVRAGEDLQALLDAPDGPAAICLGRGDFVGPLAISRAVTLWGTPESVVRSSGSGTTVAVDADGISLLGFTVDGSGGRFDQLDAAVRVRADDVRLEGLKIVNATFGLLVEKANRIVVRGNRVLGPDEGPLGLRGDAIRLWETRDSLVEGNEVAGSRDVVVWYSPRVRIAGNRIERGRYGAHLMYSHGCTVEDNELRGNVVGVFVMYSHDVTVRGNRMLDSRGAAGMGLGVKESGNLEIHDNDFVQATIGAYLDTTPIQLGQANRFTGNRFALCGTGVLFHRSETRNSFRGNVFRDNQVQVAVQGGGHVRDVEWLGNDFDDYVGYDLDGDGVGDVPYELRRLSTQLVDRQPQLAFFRGTPALAATDAASHLLPLFAPKTVLVDPKPAVGGLRAD
jgi:nitrous oxidase accessory protein